MIGRQRQDETASAAWREGDAPPPHEAPMARLVRSVRLRRALMVVVPVLLGLGLWIILARDGASPALPVYRLAVEGPGAAEGVSPGDRIDWVVRPATPVAQAQPVHGAAWVLDAAGADRLPVDLRPAPGGALRLDAPVAKALPGRTGPVTVLLVVAPGYVELDGLDPTAPPSDVRVIKHRFDIRAE